MCSHRASKVTVVNDRCLGLSEVSLKLLFLWMCSHRASKFTVVSDGCLGLSEVKVLRSCSFGRVHIAHLS